jgi:hypothetical protein
MTMRPSSFIPYKQTASAPQSTKGAADFLRAHDKMAALLPAVTRMAALQKDCASILPAMLAHCAVLQFETGQLVLSVPTAALATRLKQQSPKLQEQLLQRGWQVSAIRLKVQVSKTSAKSTTSAKPVLPPLAVSAFEELADALDDSPRNQALKRALETMARHHRRSA